MATTTKKLTWVLERSRGRPLKLTSDSKKVEGYNVHDYFTADGKYRGPDSDGIGLRQVCRDGRMIRPVKVFPNTPIDLE